jgi:acyl-CoA synthetase (AMP-forming)/AMP-acid ligase II
MYFDKLETTTNKKVGELFPNFNVMVQGGVNFEPYKAKLFESIGRKIDTVELFPASEGFFAFQNAQKELGLLLNTNSGIFFEFIPAEEIFAENPTRLCLQEVELGKNYALIINSNAGLWGYNIGDTVKFVSIDPYKIVVTGRIKHFISAFGEHVIGEEVEAALLQVAEQTNTSITEFTVAPFVAGVDAAGKSYHEWFISFEKPPANLDDFAAQLDAAMRQQNVYYDDLIKGAILEPLKIRTLQSDAFVQYMRSIGKLGGQNKVPRLSNDRVLADALSNYLAPVL